MNWRQDPTKTFFVGVMMGALIPFAVIVIGLLVLR